MSLRLTPTGFNFEQTVASTTWMITHSLGHKPVVDVMVVIDNQLVTILPLEIQHISDIQCVVSFSEPRIGKARLV